MTKEKTRKRVQAAAEPPRGELLSLKGAAAYLTVSEATLQRRIADGTLPVVRFGRRTLVRRSAIEDALIEG